MPGPRRPPKAASSDAASTEKTKKKRASGRRSGGAAGFGGYDFQAGVFAFVAAHIIAGRKLRWVKGLTDVPRSVDAETGRAADDVRVELVDVDDVLEAQVKRGLSGPAKLIDSLEGMIEDIPAPTNERGVLVVDSRSHPDIRDKFGADLDRRRDGRTDLQPITETVLAHLRDHGALGLADRLHVVLLDLQAQGALTERAVISLLEAHYGDEETAERAWSALREDAWDACVNRSRRSRPQLDDLLARKGVTPRTPLGGAAGASHEMLTLLRGIAANQGAAMSGDMPTVPGPGPGPGGHPTADAVWHARIDTARDLIAGSVPVAGLRALEQVEVVLNAAVTPAERGAEGTTSTSTDNAPPENIDLVRRRIYANRASGLTLMGALPQAAVAAEEALLYGTDDPTVLIIAARANLLAGNRERALTLARRALEISDRDAKVWSLLVEAGEAVVELSPDTDARNGDTARRRATLVVPEQLQQDPDVLAAGGLRAFNAGGLAVAERMLGEAVARGERNPERMGLLAQVRFAATKPAAGAHATHKIDEIEALVTDALGDFRETDYSIVHEQLLLLRASLRRVRDRLDGALTDAERAFRLHPEAAPDQWRSAYVAASILLDLKQPERAAVFVAGADPSAIDPTSSQATSRPGLHLLRARLHLARGDGAGAQRDLDAALMDAQRRLARARDGAPDRPTTGTTAFHDVAFTAIEVALDAGLVEYAVRVFARLARGEGGWLWDLFDARLAVARERVEDAGPAFERAAVGAQAEGDSDASARVRLEYAMALGRRGDYPAAVVQYEAADAWTFEERARPGYVHALIAAGQAETARRLLDELEAQGPLVPWALSAAATIADQRDDLEPAAEYLEALWAQKPENTLAGLRLAAILRRLGRDRDAVRVLRELGRRHGLSGEERMRLATLLYGAGETYEGLRHALRAVRLAPDDVDVAMQYIRLMSRHRDQRGRLAPKIARPDTRVTLTPVRRGAELHVTLYREGPADAARQEFLHNDPRAASFRFRRVGDVVTLRRGQSSEASYRVTAVQDALVATYQDLITHFEERFPDSNQLERFKMDDELSADSLLPIIRRLYRDERGRDRLLALYDEHKPPIGVLARGLGDSIHRAYHALSARPTAWLYTEFGADEDRERAVMAAGVEPLILTRPAIETLIQLEHWGASPREALGRTGRRLVAPRSLLDELDEQVADLRAHKDQPLRSMSTGPTGIAMHEMSAAEVAEWTALVEIHCAWVRESAHVLPRPLRALGAAGRDRRQAFGESSADALELWAEGGGTVWADDLGLRAVPIDGRRVESCSTWALFEALRRAGDITDDAAYDGVVGLVRLRHYFISVTAPLLHNALRRAAYNVTPDVLRLLDRLAEPGCPLDRLTAVIAELLRRVATDEMGGAALRPVTQVSIERMTQHRRVVPTLHALGRAVAREFALLPLAAEIIEDCMVRFEQVKRVAGSLR